MHNNPLLGMVYGVGFTTFSLQFCTDHHSPFDFLFVRLFVRNNFFEASTPVKPNSHSIIFGMHNMQSSWAIVKPKPICICDHLCISSLSPCLLWNRLFIHNLSKHLNPTTSFWWVLKALPKSVVAWRLTGLSDARYCSWCTNFCLFFATSWNHYP